MDFHGLHEELNAGTRRTCSGYRMQAALVSLVPTYIGRSLRADL